MDALTQGYPNPVLEGRSRARFLRPTRKQRVDLVGQKTRRLDFSTPALTRNTTSREAVIVVFVLHQNAATAAYILHT